MRIVNNKISIMKGETPTYTATVIDKATGAPYVVPDRAKNPLVEFAIRGSIYDRGDNFFYKSYLELQKIPRFASSVPLSYNKLDTTSEPVWSDKIAPDTDYQAKTDAAGNKYGCYLFGLTRDGVTEYRYFDPEKLSNKWTKCDFTIQFTFPYNVTSKMEAKTYKYEVTFFDAEIKKDYDKEGNDIGSHLESVSIKDPLQEPEDFIVGGTVSE